MAQVAAATAADTERRTNGMYILMSENLDGEFFTCERVLLIRSSLPKERVLEIIRERLETA